MWDGELFMALPILFGVWEGWSALQVTPLRGHKENRSALSPVLACSVASWKNVTPRCPCAAPPSVRRRGLVWLCSWERVSRNVFSGAPFIPFT